MSATTDRLTFEMQDAKRNLEWVKQELQHLYEIRRENIRNYRRAKAELKTLTDKK